MNMLYLLDSDEESVCVLCCVVSCLGDISFRFLNYTRSVHDMQLRRRAWANQTPSWQDISGGYGSEGAELPESRAVVCDINKEMLKVGKERAESTGITTGTVSHSNTRDFSSHCLIKPEACCVFVCLFLTSVVG